MQKEKEKIYSFQMEGVTLPFELGLEAFKALFQPGAKEDLLTDTWLECLENEVDKMMQTLEEEHLKNQLIILKAVAQYGHNSANTIGLYEVKHFEENKELDMVFVFKTNEDAINFLEGLIELIDTL